jgi:outer membrane protein insertion porin family
MNNRSFLWVDTMKRILFGFTLILLVSAQLVWSADQFKVQSIQIKGLKGISKEAVLAQLPVQVGEWFKLTEAEPIIKRLYNTGFFDDVKLLQEKDQLIVILKERPIITQIKLEGNHGIPQDAFDKLLKELGLSSGEFFSQAALEQLKSQLLNAVYPQASQHAAKVETRVIHRNANQVDIHLKFEPGPALRFAGIHFLGNRVFNNNQLLAALPIHTNPIWAFLTNRTTHFNEMTKQQSLDALRNFYKDRGYFDINVLSDRMSITPDRRAAYWVIEVLEGAQYRIGEFRVLGRHQLTKEELAPLIHFGKGQVYSRANIEKTKEAITHYLEDRGYLFAKVNITPTPHAKTKHIDFIIQINPGKKIYIRHIHILGNYYIQDKVIRRLLQQQEGSLSSRTALRDSESRLNRSGFIKSPAKLIPVPTLNGADDQVDVQFQMDENISKFSAMFNMGSSGGTTWKSLWDGFTVDLTTRVENIFGTGQTIDVTARKSQYDDWVVSADYDNPYFTLDGIQSYGRFYFSKTSSWSRQIGDLFGNSEEVKDLFSMDDPFESFGKAKSKQKHIAYAEDDLNTAPQQNKRRKKRKAKNIPLVTPKKKRKELLRSQYETGVLGLQTTWGFPLDNKGNLWRITLEGKSISLYLLPNEEHNQAKELKEFTKEYGDNLWQILLTTGFYHNQLEGFLFPYKGTQHNFNVSAILSWAKAYKFYPYFKVNYRGAVFYPFLKTMSGQEWSAGVRWNLGYGNTWYPSKEALPFFDNYHSGRLRGYENDSFGPQDSRGNMLGANLLVSGSAMVCFPKPISGTRHRVSMFFDVGNLYHVDRLQSLLEKDYDHLKTSMGIAVDFVVPMPVMLGSNLPVNVSFGIPLNPNKNKETGDRISHFQFSLGFSFVDQF